MNAKPIGAGREIGWQPVHRSIAANLFTIPDVNPLMNTRRVLVVEDDSAIRQGITDALQFAGYETLQAPNGNDGMAQGLRATFDLLLLDLILPGHSGFEILKAVRAARPTLPVIILTARGEEHDRVEGLRLGADDYVVKPFSVRELLAHDVDRRKPAARRGEHGAQVEPARQMVIELLGFVDGSVTLREERGDGGDDALAIGTDEQQ